MLLMHGHVVLRERQTNEMARGSQQEAKSFVAFLTMHLKPSPRSYVAAE